MRPGEDQFEKFERLGEDEVRRGLAAGRFNDPRLKGVAEEWLRRQDEARAAGDAKIAEDRTVESLGLEQRATEAAEEANRIANDASATAEEANKHARWANIIAWIALAFAVTPMLWTAIHWLSK